MSLVVVGHETPEELDALYDLTITSHVDSFGDSPYPEVMNISFRTHGQNFNLHLKLKRDLFAPNTYVYMHGGPENNLIPVSTPKLIAYQASMSDGGYVRLTMHGREHFHATIKLNENEFYVVDPAEQHDLLPGTRKLVERSRNRMVSYKMSTLPDVGGHGRRLAYGRMRKCTWEAQEILVGVAADAGYTNEQGDRSSTETTLISVYNSINGLYDDQIGVHITIGSFVLQDSPGGVSWNVSPNKGSGGSGCGDKIEMDNHLDALKAYV